MDVLSEAVHVVARIRVIATVHVVAIVAREVVADSAVVAAREVSGVSRDFQNLAVEKTNALSFFIILACPKKLPVHPRTL